VVGWSVFFLKGQKLSKIEILGGLGLRQGRSSVAGGICGRMVLTVRP